jgi:hypothetical protein
MRWTGWKVGRQEWEGWGAAAAVVGCVLSGAPFLVSQLNSMFMRLDCPALAKRKLIDEFPPPALPVSGLFPLPHPFRSVVELVGPGALPLKPQRSIVLLGITVCSTGSAISLKTFVCRVSKRARLYAVLR